MSIINKIIFTITLWACIIFILISTPFFYILNLLRFKTIFRFFSAKKRNLKILFLENQPAIHAGAHYRVEIVKNRLEKDGFVVNVHYPFSEDEFEKTKQADYDKHLLLSKMLVKKLFYILKAYAYDLVIVRRELLHFCEYGGVFFERFLLMVNKKVVLDMDDYMPYLRAKKNINKFSFFNKINLLNQNKSINVFNVFSYYTVAVDSFIAAIKNDNLMACIKGSHTFPMCVDYTKQTKDYNTTTDKAKKKVGWISQSIHFSRIDEIIPYLNKVYDKVTFELIIVADKPYYNNKLNVPLFNFKWSLESEKDLMLTFDIGIAPIVIPKSEQNRKGTFKLVQYMSLGLVSLVTALPYTEGQVIDGVNGFLIYNMEEWEEKLLNALTLSNNELALIGEEAYNSFYKKHHIDSQYPLLRQFYHEIIFSK